MTGSSRLRQGQWCVSDSQLKGCGFAHRPGDLEWTSSTWFTVSARYVAAARGTHTVMVMPTR